MWIAAADKNGKIPNNSEFIRKMCLLDEPPNLQRFKALGFLDNHLTTKNEDIDNHLPTINPNLDAPEESRVEESRVEKHFEHLKGDALITRKDFEILWEIYPEKKGKEKAWLKFKAQIKTPHDWENIDRALRNYKREVKRSREYGHPDLNWQHGSTWFNHSWKDYVDYQPPAKTPKDGIRKPQELDKQEMESEIAEQVSFVKQEIAEGAVRDKIWLDITLCDRLGRYEKRFKLDPLSASERVWLNGLISNFGG